MVLFQRTHNNLMHFFKHTSIKKSKLRTKSHYDAKNHFKGQKSVINPTLATEATFHF